MLKAQGVDFNEAMVFGLASALTFVYIPLVKVNGMPLISYRMPPKSIIKNVAKRLKVRLKIQKFRAPQAGQDALDLALAENKLVGLQTSVFWLPYFPPEMRFHFNAHNLIVYGKEHAEDLQRARFVKGVLAPKGLMYYFESQPNLTKIDLPSMTRKAIRKNAKQMLAPLFFVGVKGIRTVAKQIEKLANHPSDKYKRLYLGHIVRMQEEIGTGGAGFRYLYAYFLEQASDICQEPKYKQTSEQMTEIGDMWRQFAGLCVKQCKKPTNEGYHTVAEYLRDIANKEQQIWQTLRNL